MNTSRRVALLAPLSLCLALAGARADTPVLDALNPSLTLRFESEFGLATRYGHTQKFDNTLFADLTLDPFSNLQLVARLRIRSEVLDELDPGDFEGSSYAHGTRPATPGDFTEIEHREVFAQWTYGPLRVRAGKQQLVWGEADGLKVLDLLNPQDLREFILPDFSESRIPLWALSTELELGETGPRGARLPEGTTLQLLFIPDPTVHHIPDLEDLGDDPAAPFAPTSDRIVPVPPELFASAVDFPASHRRPRWKASNFDAGARLTVPVGRVDTAFYYLWHMDDSPVIEYGPGSLELDGRRLFLQVPVELTNNHYHMAGASFSTALGDWVVRGEFSFAFNRDISQTYLIQPSVVNDENEQVGNSDDIAWMIGVDWFGLDNTLVSVQAFQNRIIHHEDEMLRRKVETAMTFLARRTFFNERLTAEVIYLFALKDKDGAVRPRVEYEWNDHLSLWVAMDIFHGPRDGYFGQYKRNDRVLFGVALGWTSD